MKKTTILLLLTLCISILGFSQNDIKSSKIKTTYEEYNFLTEHYGLADNATILEGYELQNFLNKTLGKFNYNYQLFIEKSSRNVKAIFITITKIKRNADKVRYICMPLNNEELYKKFQSETDGLGISMSLGFDALNKVLISRLIDEKFNIGRADNSK